MNTCCRWYKTDIKGAPEGKLKGKRLAIKDCVFLAGVPIINGSHLMSGFIPDQDATIITRMLDAGWDTFIYASFYLYFISYCLFVIDFQILSDIVYYTLVYKKLNLTTWGKSLRKMYILWAP